MIYSEMKYEQGTTSTKAEIMHGRTTVTVITILRIDARLHHGVGFIDFHPVYIWILLY